MRKRHLAVEGPDADGDLRVPELEEGPVRWRVGNDERDDGSHEHDGGRLGRGVRELDELTQPLVATLHLGDEQPVGVGIIGAGNDGRVGEVLARVSIVMLVGHQKLLRM